MDKFKIINYFKAQAINGAWASLYDEKNPISYSFIRRFIATVKLMQPIKGNVLDMGCGTGILVTVAVENNAYYTGFDAAQEMIDACNIQFKQYVDSGKVNFLCCDSKNFIVPKPFDTAVGMGYLEYFSNPDECLTEAKNVLVPGGKLILSFPHKYSLDNFGLLLFKPFRWIATLLTGKRTHQPPRKYWSKKEAIKLFEKNGYQVKELVFYNTTFFHYPFTKIIPKFSNFVASKIENTVLNKIPFLSTGFIICSVKKN